MADHARAAHQREAPAEGVGTRPARVEQIDRSFGQRVEGTGRERRGRGLRIGPDPSREHENRHGSDAHDSLDGLEAGHSGQLDVHRDEIGREPADRRDGVLGRASDADDVEQTVVLDHALQRCGVGPRVLTDQDARPRRLAHPPTIPATVSSSAC